MEIAPLWTQFIQSWEQHILWGFGLFLTAPCSQYLVSDSSLHPPQFELVNIQPGISCFQPLKKNWRCIHPGLFQPLKDTYVCCISYWAQIDSGRVIQMQSTRTKYVQLYMQQMFLRTRRNSLCISFSFIKSILICMHIVEQQAMIATKTGS